MDSIANANKLNHQLNRLKTRHRKLKDRIGQEMKRPKPDTLLLQKLKRLRLRTKDGMIGAMRSLNGVKSKSIPQTL